VGRFKKSASQLLPGLLQILFQKTEIVINHRSRIVINRTTVRTADSRSPVSLPTWYTEGRHDRKSSLLPPLESKPVAGLVYFERLFTTRKCLPKLDAPDLDISKTSKVSNQTNRFSDDPVSRRQFRIRDDVLDLRFALYHIPCHIIPCY
jgi:hypothetical protein